MNEMPSRLLTTQHSTYVLDSWDGKNRSGITPAGDKVLVLVDGAEEKTKGGILRPVDHQERHTLASTTGILIAAGAMAFAWNSSRTIRWEGVKPEVGDRVIFTKYAGTEYTGHDGALYRVMDDTCIGGTMGRAIEGKKP